MTRLSVLDRLAASYLSRPAPLRRLRNADTGIGTRPERDLGLQWVKHSAEYQAIARQVYRSAEAALPGYIDDTTWSAMPGQASAADLPPAVILDVDETVVSNVDFQLTFERPFANHKLNSLEQQLRIARPLPASGISSRRESNLASRYSS